MDSKELHKLLAANRTEELGYDVWEQFVVPPYYQALSVGDTKKPQVIIGGRGCGKTMLLRYLSHESTFSTNRTGIRESDLQHIGLYWRADTQFASLMQKRSLDEDIWVGAFNHLAAVVLSKEVLSALQSIAKSTAEIITGSDLQQASFKRLKAFSDEIPEDFQGLKDYLEDELAKFEMWVNDVRTVKQPLFLPGHKFIKRLIDLVKIQIPNLEPAIFFVYVDEYENLALYQQRIINTWLKHSGPPLIFNIAMKRNSFKTHLTQSEEPLSRTHDYRVTDIEEFTEREFQLFAAEILLMRIAVDATKKSAIDLAPLRDTTKAGVRYSAEYTDQVLSAAKSLLPTSTHHELAIEAIKNKSIRLKLTEQIESALELRRAKSEAPSEFINNKHPEASIIMPALLSREGLSTAKIKDQFDKLKAGEENSFTGQTGWIHNNFIGCYLQLYYSLNRLCPFYGGFATYCSMAKGNLRHFLELCFHALGRLQRAGNADAFVPIPLQAEAARQVATNLLGEVKSFGPQGNNLHTFLLRVGSLFSLSQQRPSQSEPERTHFAIYGGTIELNSSESEFLAEAVKWSVLFEGEGTKKKNPNDPEGIEYVLNPIYSSYFHISYRKRRKLDLTANDMSTLISGSYEDVRGLLGSYKKRWSVNLMEASLPLFSHLAEEL